LAWWQRLAAGESPMALPLYNRTLQLLADPSYINGDIGWETGVWEKMLGRALTPAEKSRRKQIEIGAVRRISRQMHSAHKYTWHPSFADLVAAAAVEKPRVLRDIILPTARMSFESGDTWLEWPHRYLDKTGTARQEVWGALITPQSGGFFTAYIVNAAGSFLTGMLVFDFRVPLEPQDDRYYALVLGDDYVRRWERTDKMALLELSRHATVNLSMMMKDWGEDFGKYCEDHGLDGLADRYTTDLRLIGGVFRELLCGCAMMVTHFDDGPLVIEGDPVKVIRQYAGRGRFHPSYEFKTIRLRRPQELPKVLRRIRHVVRIGRLHLPYHPVSGHWDHRIAPAIGRCELHPRACVEAQWRSTKRPEAGLFGHDAKPLCEHDYQRCIHCARPRWWVKDHHRGSEEYGIIEHTYEITASTRRRTPPPPPDTPTPVPV
jgi:hypothetical protein